MKNSITNNILYFLFFVFQILFSQENLISKTKLYDINGIKYLSALEYAKTQNIEFSARFANNAAATAVSKSGTATVTINEINNYILLSFNDIFLFFV